MGATVVSGLVEEVIDLVRHDNIDVRALDWLAMAYNDMVTRVPLWRFVDQQQVEITAGKEQAQVASARGYHLMGAIFTRTADGVVYTPRYVSPVEFRNTAHYREGGNLLTSDIPLMYSIGFGSRMDGEGSTAGNNFISVYPAALSGYIVTVLGSGRAQHEPPAWGAYMQLPYHFEHCLVWGAAAIGIKAVRPPAYPIFAAEYEQALSELQATLLYKPDGTPSYRSIMGPYAGGPQLKAGPRLPRTI